MENCGTVRRATDDNTIGSMRCALWITNAADTHTEYVRVNAYPWRTRLSALFIGTWPVLFIFFFFLLY